MRIAYDGTGKILCWGIHPNINGVEFETVPNDFIDFAGLGKYKIENDVITEVGGWEMPTAKTLDQVMDHIPEVLS